jgi:nicotinate-nucleotide adenylyltransferase
MGRIRKKRIGVMGGSFNPIHTGHLFAAEEALFHLSLDQVVFVPSPRPPFKQEEDLLDAETRYLMAALATAANPRFTVSRVEMEREGVSYTVDTVRELRKSYPARSEVYFIMGMDAAMELADWKDPEGLLEMCFIVVVSRPGHDRDQVMKGLDARTKRLLRHPNLRFMETPGLNVSASDIRERVREGRPYRYLLPEAVAGFIDGRGLYR